MSNLWLVGMPTPLVLQVPDAHTLGREVDAHAPLGLACPHQLVSALCGCSHAP